jgi:hypothetical protein
MEDKEQFGLGELPESAANSTDVLFAKESSEFTRKDFESDLAKVSKRIKKIKPSPKSS